MSLTSIVKPSYENKVLPPKFVENDPEALALYKETDLTYSAFQEGIAKLAGARRDDVAPSTIRIWFGLALKKGWSKDKYFQQIDNAMNAQIWGAVDWKTITDSEPLYNEAEMRKMVASQIDELVKEGEKLLKGKNFEVEYPITIDLDLVKVSVAEKVKRICKVENEREFIFLIDDIAERVMEESGYKKTSTPSQFRKSARERFEDYINRPIAPKQEIFEARTRKTLTKEERKRNAEEFRKIVEEEMRGKNA